MVSQSIKSCLRKLGLQRKGFGTLEVVIIIAVLLSIALIFRASLTDFAKNLMRTVFSEKGVLEELSENTSVN